MTGSDDFSFDIEGDQLALQGVLTLAHLDSLSNKLNTLPSIKVIDLSNLHRMDTAGAWVVHKLAQENNAEVKGADAGMAHILERISQYDRPLPPEPKALSPLIYVLTGVGKNAVHVWYTALGLINFFGALLISIWHTICHPSRLRTTAIICQMESVGVNALAIVGLMSVLVGVVIAQQGAVQLRQFGAEIYSINLVGRISFRELGVLMTAIMVAGRSGSAFAAQIGSMNLAEEIDAMRIIGVSPMESLVLPRFIASILMMPLLGFYATIAAIVGGGLLCWSVLDIPPTTFITRLREVIPYTDVAVGLIKAPIFGALIAVAGCFQGTQVKGNAEQLGYCTTKAVVHSIFLVIVLDAFFAVFFSEIGWV
ncbi:MAG: ABC transporter permease [Zymomonas mobilis]|uniref:Phospholipid/cholesterol/gamma-HCH transport system permease protein n=1 Tax=Zymomonas mobilis TaxID=542 RepID=A0A542W1H8_ZYMMB|nr:ABC transporter permease [Zymomonas mobilis]TQL17418.1 phospholipid/cholesterol/gamma-HCH transport system permease protein [Zymomonas mobilis]